MYNSHFHFRKRPFAAVPQVDQYFPGAAIEAARTTLCRCIQRGEGAGLVIGPSGTGKTLLCQVLAEQMKDRFRVSLLSSGRLGTRRNLLQAILYTLGRPYRGMDEGELRLALVDYLTTHEEGCRGIVLVIDEAHTLPVRLLEEIRLLTNLACNGQPQVRLVLAGSGALEERFAGPKLAAFSQRLAARCYLEPFNGTETQQYIHGQIETAGARAETLFPAETCQRVQQATDGVPRLINQVCDHALVLAYVAGRRQIEPACIQEAWADLQQLPTPWNGQGEKEKGGVIEFGRLDDSAGETAGEPSVPMLRISPDTSLAETSCPEPAEQIRHIEKLLSVVAEEEFAPARTGGTEVELVFDDPERLLQEEFDEEEVVTDRHDQFAETSRPWDDLSAEPAGDGIAAESQADASQPEATPLPTDAAISVPGPADAPVAAAGDRQTVPMRHQRAAALVERDDDIIVVEDDYEEPPAPKCRIMPVKRHEYSRLFAKLRHG